MKRPFFFFALFALLLSVQCLMAAPLRNVEVRLTQPNGEVIHCFASGDEFYNYLHDADGFTIVKGEGGYYFYATYDADGQVVPSAYKVNSVAPAAVGLQPKVLISEQEYYARRQERESHFRYGSFIRSSVISAASAASTASSLPKAPMATPASAVDSMFNAANYESISLRNFYHRASYNQLDLRSYLYPIPDGETILSYEDIYPKEYYMPYDPETNPIGYQNGETADREFSMLERAIYYVADQVSDTLDLDYNDDGLVDNVVFVITLLSLALQGTTITAAAHWLGLATEEEKIGNDFGIELPDELESKLSELKLTEESLSSGNQLKDMHFPQGTLVMMVKRGNSFIVPNGQLELKVGDILLTIANEQMS